MKIPEMNRKNKLFLLLAFIVLAVPSYLIFDYTQNNPKFCTTCHLMDDAYETWEGSAMHDIGCKECHHETARVKYQHVEDVLFRNPDEVHRETVIDSKYCEDCHASEDPEWLQVVSTDGHKQHFYGEENHAECMDCHGIELHIFRPPEEGCLDCHDEGKVHATEAMDATCVTCHDFLTDGNGFIPEERDDCLECHENNALVTVSTPVEAHVDSSCLDCHNPHENEVTEDCSTCHIVNDGLHAEPTHTDCTSCHVPHFEVEVRQTCVACHSNKEEHYAPADCTSCHN